MVDTSERYNEGASESPIQRSIDECFEVLGNLDVAIGILSKRLAVVSSQDISTAKQAAYEENNKVAVDPGEHSQLMNHLRDLRNKIESQVERVNHTVNRLEI